MYLADDNSQQTTRIDPMLVLRWASVADGGSRCLLIAGGGGGVCSVAPTRPILYLGKYHIVIHFILDFV